jgi:hypothetical protein
LQIPFHQVEDPFCKNENYCTGPQELAIENRDRLDEVTKVPRTGVEFLADVAETRADGFDAKLPTSR